MTAIALVSTDRSPVALVDQAERALAAVETPDDAEVLLRKVATVDDALRRLQAHTDEMLAVGKLKLRVERRLGELLGPAKAGRPSSRVTAGHTTTPAERMVKRRARQLAAVPASIFDGYLVAATDPDELRRARLLRAAGLHDHRRKPAHQRVRSPNASIDDTTIAGAMLAAIDLQAHTVVDDVLTEIEHHVGDDRFEFSERLEQAQETLADLADRLRVHPGQPSQCACDHPLPDGSGCSKCGRTLPPRPIVPPPR